MPVSSESAPAAGTLFVVATPIGNLGDMTPRGVEVLQQADLIAAEDTRHSRRLAEHFGIATPMLALHEHNERSVAARLVERLRQGESIALISDAGTPLISDPGYQLVRAAREAGVPVVPVPGASALVAALSVAGLPTDRFVFEGFLPPRQAARRKRLEALKDEPRTLVFYESSHRIVDSLNDLKDVFGPGRQALLARELTKAFETTLSASLGELHERVIADTNQQRGEFVIVVQGAPAADAGTITPEAERLLSLLLEDLPAKKAAKLVARITGLNKRQLYETAIKKNTGKPDAP